jgi:hypothetical protein
MEIPGIAVCAIVEAVVSYCEDYIQIFGFVSVATLSSLTNRKLAQSHRN